MSAKILAWPKHLRTRCPATCDGCQLCLGGLLLCSRCKGFEGSLPTECPGEEMTFDQEMLVYEGSLNFFSGIWVDSTNIRFRKN
jgi:hypothetical protein